MAYCIGLLQALPNIPIIPIPQAGLQLIAPLPDQLLPSFQPHLENSLKIQEYLHQMSLVLRMWLLKLVLCLLGWVVLRLRLAWLRVWLRAWIWVVVGQLVLEVVGSRPILQAVPLHHLPHWVVDSWKQAQKMMQAQMRLVQEQLMQLLALSQWCQVQIWVSVDQLILEVVDSRPILQAVLLHPHRCSAFESWMKLKTMQVLSWLVEVYCRFWLAWRKAQIWLVLGWQAPQAADNKPTLQAVPLHHLPHWVVESQEQAWHLMQAQMRLVQEQLMQLLALSQWCQVQIQVVVGQQVPEVADSKPILQVALLHLHRRWVVESWMKLAQKLMQAQMMRMVQVLMRKMRLLLVWSQLVMVCWKQMKIWVVVVGQQVLEVVGSRPILQAVLLRHHHLAWKFQVQKWKLRQLQALSWLVEVCCQFWWAQLKIWAVDEHILAKVIHRPLLHPHRPHHHSNQQG